METTPGKRVQMLREAKGYTSLTAFAEFTKLKVGTLSALEKDKSSPSLETMAKLIEAFPDANLDWLVTGFGPMLKNGKTLTAASTEAEKPEPPKPAGPAAIVSRGQVVEHADTVLLLSETEQKLVEVEKELTGFKSENQQLAERLKDAKEEILWLRGKSTPSSYAAESAQLPVMEIRRWQAVYNDVASAVEGGKVIMLCAPGEYSDLKAA